jgi:hypothetical protein
MCLYGLFENMKIRFSPLVAQCVACFGLGLAVAGLILVCGCGSPVEPEPEPEPIVAVVLVQWSESVHPTLRPDSMTLYADGVFIDDASGYLQSPYSIGLPLYVEDFSPETVFTVYVYGVPEQYTGNYWSKMTVGVGYENVIITLVDVVPNPVFTFSLPAWLYE